MFTHAPTPWTNVRHGSYFDILAADGRLIATIHGDAKEALPNLLFIVHACNIHHDLQDSLKALTCTTRTFRNVPLAEQEWTPIDDEVLDGAFGVLERSNAVRFEVPVASGGLRRA